MEKFIIKVDYTYSLEEIIYSAGIKVNIGINSTNFSLADGLGFARGGQVELPVSMVSFEIDLDHYKAVAEAINAMGFRPASLAEMICFVHQHHTQANSPVPIVSLGSTMVMVSAGLIIPFFSYPNTLGLMGNQFPWRKGKFRFLVTEQ